MPPTIRGTQSLEQAPPNEPDTGPLVGAPARPALRAVAWAGWPAMLGLVAVLGACGSERATQVTAYDFVGEEVLARPAAAPTPVRTIGVDEAREGITDAAAATGTPDGAIAQGGSPALAPGQDLGNTTPADPQRDGPARVGVAGVLIEEKVGDINGSPVYASRFFEGGLLERLIADRATMSEREWTIQSRKAIADKLEALIVDELLRAEALAKLSPGQRQGLRAFVRAWQEDIVRYNRGARALADDRLRASGTSLDKLLQQRETAELVQMKLREMTSTVYVSRREIEIEYERRQDVYRPNPLATVRLMRVPADDRGAIDAILGALADGVAFPEVATTGPNTFKPDLGGLLVLDQEVSGPLHEAQLTAIDELNVALRSLEAGEWAGPIVVGESAWFVQLESLKQLDIPVEVAQLELAQDIRAREEGLAQYEYVENLKDRASFTSVDAMTERLLEIARDRVSSAGRS